MALIIKELAKSYPMDTGLSLDVLKSIDITVYDGEFVSIIGPSGSGKSTLCNLIAGIEMPDSGDIYLADTKVTGSTGQVGYMPQKDLLLPWRTLLENVILGREVSNLNKQTSKKEGMEWLKRFGLAEFANHYPSQLSGGMRQRGALLRTIMFGKPTLLLDEPFGALDALTRREMQQWLLTVWSATTTNVLFITHDIDEAILLSDRIVVLSRRPAEVMKEFSVPFPRPRELDLLLTPEAIGLKRELLELLLNH